MRQLFYLSRAVDGLKESDVLQILARSRANNWRIGITGCLLFSGSHFAQMLEGEASVVQGLADRIATDPRHTDFRIVLDREDRQRRYPDWSMGFLYSADFGDRLEHALAHPQALSDRELSELAAGMRLDSLMGPL